MWYTELDPRTMEPVYVAKSPHDKALQRALLQWKRPEKRRLVVEALHRAGRTDLIGFGRECLVRPLGEVRNPAQRESRARPAKGAKPPARRAEKSGARGRQGRGRKK